MKFPNLKIGPMLKQHLALVGERYRKPQISAETQLLRKEVEQSITSALDHAIEDATFGIKYADIINMSPSAIADHDYMDLLHSLCPAGHGLVLKRPQQDAGVLLIRDTPLEGWRDNFLPLPLNLQTLTSAKTRSHLTRRHVAQWDRAAVLVPDSSVPNLVHLLRAGKTDVRGIVAGDGGVMTIFGVKAKDFRSWKDQCMSLSTRLKNSGIKGCKFSMHNLVPISRESRGRGALLYLA